LELQQVKSLLDHYSSKINVAEFIESDPVRFVHKYTLLQDIEIAGVLSAVNAWGRRDMILRDLTRIFAIMGQSPYDFVMSADLDAFTGNGALHRTFNLGDFGYLCKGFRQIYSQRDTLEQFFVDCDLFDGIASFRNAMIAANGAGQRSEKHLSNPASGSACKRLHLFLRWMVRNDGIVDLGVWRSVSPSSLYIPLDVHVGRISRWLGLVVRKQNDRKTVEELTAVLRSFNPADPTLYDFGLFGIGEQKLDKIILDAYNRNI
jgi:uncharacterized protein (TIGR02757 family)